MFIVFFGKPHFNTENFHLKGKKKKSQAKWGWTGEKYRHGGVPRVLRVHLTMAAPSTVWTRLLCVNNSLPSLENFYIQRRNSKSSDANRKGMGEFLGLRDRWNFEKLYFKSLSVFRFVLREMDMYSHFVKCFESHLGFGSVLPVPASRYSVSAASNLTKASADTRVYGG